MSRPTIIGKNDLLTFYPDVAKEWHPTKNKGIDIRCVAYGSNMNVWWLLPYDTDDGRHFDFEWQSPVYERTLYNNGCPYLCGKKVYKGFNDLESNDKELAQQWHPTKNGDLTPDQVTSCCNKYVWWLFPYDDPITGKHFDFEWQAKISNRRTRRDCPYLTGKLIWPGFNDLSTTHPHIAACLLDQSIGTKIKYGTHVRYKFVCPNCGEIVEKKPSLVFNEYGWFVCHRCGDGFSYPEKFLSSVLDQLKLDYVHQLTTYHFDWCDKYRYDFYISGYKMIIETHGEQHYRDCSWSKCEDVQKNDADKMKLALDNKIEIYIVIDARYSQLNYIKLNIEKTLGKYFDLSSIDWAKCEYNAVSSALIKLCNDWDNRIDKNISLTNFAKDHRMERGTVRRYLTTGTQLGMCNYELQTNNPVSVVCIEDKLIFDSLGIAGKYYGVAGSTIGAVADKKRDIYKDYYYKPIGKHFMHYQDLIGTINELEYKRIKKEDVYR